MKLINLIDVADDRISIILDGIDNTGKERSYNFAEGKWADDYLFKPESISTVGEFRSSKLYKSLKSNRLEDFSTFRINTIKSLENQDTYRGIVLKVKVYTCAGKSSIAKAIEARVNMLASKHTKHKKPSKSGKPKKDNRSWDQKQHKYSDIRKVPAPEVESK